MDICTMDMIMNRRYARNIMLVPTFHKVVPLHIWNSFVKSDQYGVSKYSFLQHIPLRKVVSKYHDMILQKSLGSKSFSVALTRFCDVLGAQNLNVAAANAQGNNILDGNDVHSFSRMLELWLNNILLAPQLDLLTAKLPAKKAPSAISEPGTTVCLFSNSLLKMFFLE